MRVCCRISMLYLMGVGCFGQQTAEVSAGPATAVFKSSTNLVQVPVVVRDAGGHAVGALKAEDFQLSDGGKAQLISRFSVEKFETRESLGTAGVGESPRPADSAAAGPSVSAGPPPDRFV